MKRIASLLAGLSCACAPGVPENPPTGTVVCRVLVDRAPASLPRVVVDKNVEHCGVALLNPVLEVADLRVKSAVVSVEWPRAIPTDAPATIELKSAGCIMQPRVQIARLGDVLVVGSGDDITHNPHGWIDGGVTVFNFTLLDSSFSFKRTLDQAARYRIDCDTHLWMRAYVHVFDHPFAALTDDAGVAELRAPVGKQTLTIWHEVLGTREIEVLVEEGKTAEVTVTFELVDHREHARIPPMEEPWKP